MICGMRRITIYNYSQDVHDFQDTLDNYLLLDRMYMICRIDKITIVTIL